MSILERLEQMEKRMAEMAAAPAAAAAAATVVVQPRGERPPSQVRCFGGRWQPYCTGGGGGSPRWPAFGCPGAS